MSETTFDLMGQIFPGYSQRFGFEDKGEYKKDNRELKEKLYQMYQSGLSINSIAIMAFALENLAELSKSELNFKNAIMLLEEAIELYSDAKLEKVLNCMNKILEINSHLNERSIEKKYRGLIKILQERYILNQFIRGKKS